MSSYMDRIKICVLTALRNSPCTFEEVIRKCAGVYPTLVKEALDELKVHSSLVPLYTTQEDFVPYDINAAIDYPQANLVTYQIDNNPVLSNWYFSWYTCQKIGQIDLWHDKSILFLGTPRLFEFFAIQDKARFISLIDFDNIVTDKLTLRYGQRKNVSIEHKDINFLESGLSRKYDYVFFDPPWYLDSYISWLITAAKLVTPEGKVIFPIFPYMTRPTASQERNRLFQISRQISPNVLLIPEYLEYDIPSFEEKELHYAGIDLRANWKVSDLMILQGIHNISGDWDSVHVDTEYLSWKEFNWFGIRWFVRIEGTTEQYHKTMGSSLISLFDNSLYLKTPSRQNPRLKLANVLSSKGHGFLVKDPIYFIDVMEKVSSYDQTEVIDAVWENFSIDEDSKRVIESLRGER